MKRAQYATEYLIIVAFALLAIIPLLVIYGTEKSTMEAKVNADQVMQIARKVVDASETVYYLGQPSKTTLKVYMPSNVENVTIYSNEIVFAIRTNGMFSDVVQQSTVNMSGSISSTSGIKYITITAQDSGVLIS